MQPTTIHNIVNLGIGIFRLTEENFQNTLQELEKNYSNLKELGEREKTVKLSQIEELLIKGIRDSRKIESEIVKILDNFQLSALGRNPKPQEKSTEVQPTPIQKKEKRTKKTKAA
jgi:hypothetical protein